MTDSIHDSDEQAQFRAEVRDFFAAHGRPRQATGVWDLPIHLTAESARAAFDRGRAWQRTLFEHSMAALTFPVEYGGRGGKPWHERIFAEEAAGYDTNAGFISSTMAMLAPTLLGFADAEQKAHFLPRLLSAEYAFCQLFSEPGAGSDLAGLGCRAVLDGDEFVVSGQKVWNSAAQFCNWGMLLVRTDTNAPKHRGITFLLVDMSSPGIEVRPLVQPTGGSEFNEVFLDEVRVPVSQVIGAVNEGWAPARAVLSNESAFIGGGNTAMSSADRLRLLLQEFGGSTDPVMRQEIAQVVIRERILKMLSERIMTALRQRQAPPVDPSIIKLAVAENRVHSGNLAMRIAGARGTAALDTDDDLSRWVQFDIMSRFMISIGGGTNEVQRNNLAERALGLPKEPRDDHLKAWKDIPR